MPLLSRAGLDRLRGSKVFIEPSRPTKCCVGPARGVRARGRDRFRRGRSSQLMEGSGSLMVSLNWTSVLHNKAKA